MIETKYPKRVTKEEGDKIRSLYKEGNISIAQLARNLNKDYQVLYRLIKYKKVYKKKYEATGYKKFIKDLKNKSCCPCGEKHPATLDFHHKDPSKKLFSFSRGSLNNYTEEEIVAEINKCEILCSNCHRKKHFDENQIVVASSIKKERKEVLTKKMSAKRKLTEANISGIKYLRFTEGVKLRDIADTYGVSHVQIWRIINGVQRNEKNK